MTKKAELAFEKLERARSEANAMAACIANTYKGNMQAANAYQKVFNAAVAVEKAVKFMGLPGTSDAADIARIEVAHYQKQAKEAAANLDPRQVRAAAVAAIAAAEGK